MPDKNLGVWGETPSIANASQTPIFVRMEETYLVAAVRVSKSIRFCTAVSSQRAACEAELSAQGLKALLWVEGSTEEEALDRAMQAVALQMLDRG